MSTSSVSTTSDTGEFTYTALDPNSIRLLSFHPNHLADHDIHCNLTTVPFREKPSYEVLSYTWDDGAADCTITLNGCKFKVQGRLMHALRFARRRSLSGEVQKFWCHTICVNPADLEERKEHLFTLRQVVFRASSVLAWLGDNHPTDDHRELPRNKSSSKTEGSDFNKKSTHKLNSNHAERVISASFWRRVWAMQEVLHFQEFFVCFGTNTYKWEDIVTLVEPVIQYGKTVEQDAFLRLIKARKNRYTLKLQDMSQLLMYHQCTLAPDPRDIMFSLKGFVMEQGHVDFPDRDYEKSLLQIWVEMVNFTVQSPIDEAYNDPAALSDRLIDFHLMKKILTLEDATRIPGEIQEFHGIDRADGLHNGFACNVTVVGQVVDTCSVLDMASDLKKSSQYFCVSQQADVVVRSILHPTDQRFTQVRKISGIRPSGAEVTSRPNGSTSSQADDDNAAASTAVALIIDQKLGLKKRCSNAAIVPQGTERGDFICRLTDVPDNGKSHRLKYFVARKTTSDKEADALRHSLIGTAFLGEEFQRQEDFGPSGVQEVLNPELTNARRNAMLFHTEALYWLLF